MDGWMDGWTNESSTKALWHWPLKFLPPVQETKPNPHRSRESVQWPKNKLLQRLRVCNEKWLIKRLDQPQLDQNVAKLHPSIHHHCESPRGHISKTKELPKTRHYSTIQRTEFHGRVLRIRWATMSAKCLLHLKKNRWQLVLMCEGGMRLVGGLVERTIKMGVSKNNGTPKSSVLIGFSILNHPFWGTINFGNTQICLFIQ